MQNKPHIDEKFPFIPLLLICLLALWLRLPGISFGMPYFYAEDEAHHFNRTVEMVKEGRYDPQYFHKPSLHFYLRMPIVALSYLWSAKQGYLTSVKDIETRNSFGLAGYAFTASHPGIVKWNRTFSVALSLLAIVFTFLLCREVTGSTNSALAAALLLSVSPEFLINSPIIGVDILMALMCVVSVFAGLLVYKHYTTRSLCVVGILCGLAVSSKYNALPIAALPLAVCYCAQRLSARDLGASILMPAVGFFLGSPFILTSIPLFLDHLAYEIWHYGVAGHEGHTAQPGLEQAAFYARWLVTDGVGWSACMLALVGLGLLKSKRQKEVALFLVFPAMFAALMIGQKANFTRNMVSILPFVAILAAAGLELLLRVVVIRDSARPLFFWLCLPLLCLQPLIGSLSYIKDIRFRAESRVEAKSWIESETSADHDMAISGKLQFPTSVYRLPGKSRVDASRPLGLELYQSGFDRLVVGPEYQTSPEDTTLVKPVKTFIGINEAQRLVMNPEINVFDLHAEKAQAILTEQYKRGELAEKYVLAPAFSCTDGSGKDLMSAGEDYCWLKSRFGVLVLRPTTPLPKSTRGILELEFMSPWPNQTLELRAKEWSYRADLSQVKSGEWTTLKIPISSDILQSPEGILFHISEVHSPAARKINTDTRRLGAAIKTVQFLP